jgi:hypothetical protein
VTIPDGAAIVGQVTQVDDFHVVLVDSAGKTHGIDRVPGVKVEMRDPLKAHLEIIQRLANKDMHDVTAYLETLK